MTGPLVLPACTLDLDRHEVTRDGESTTLTATEARLLGWLVANAGRTVTREELLREVWGYRDGVETMTVQTTIRRVRAKIEADPAEPVVLTTVYGVGYRFELPAAEDEELVGRSSALGTLRQQVRGARIVTITGPGGVGKTTLATRFAREDGALVCDLASCRGAHDVVRAVSAVLGVEPRPVAPVEQARLLVAAVRTPTVLVLDNAEQLLRDVDPVLDALASGPMRLVVTSRRELSLPGERVLDLQPLDASAAIRLFSLRARPHRRDDFAPADIERIRRIVAALDGLPLAIELAAARLRVMGLADIEQRVGHDLSLLGGGAPGRHASIEHALAWSWQLLGAHERAVVEALSAFAGPIELDAAAAVAGMQPTLLVDVLDSLRRQAMLQRSPDGPDGRARYTMLETIRSYARERLMAEGSWRDVVTRHARWFAERGWAASGLGRQSTRDASGLQQLLPEVVGACAHGLQLEAVVHARLALVAFRGLSAGAASAIDAVLARSDVPRPWRALVTGARGHLDRVQRDREGAERRLGEATALAEGDPAVLTHVQTWATVLHMESGDWDRAESCARTAERCAVEAGLGSARLAAVSNQAAIRWYRGEQDAVADFETAQRIAEELGDEAALADVLTNHGGLQIEVGRLDRAMPLLLRALALAERAGGHRRLALAANNLAALHREQGRLAEAEQLFARSIAHFRRATLRVEPAVARLNVGYCLLEEGRFDDADIAASEATQALDALSPRWAAYGHALAGVTAHARGWLASAAERYDRALAATPPADRRFVLLSARRAVLDPAGARSWPYPGQLAPGDALGRWELHVHEGHLDLARGNVDAARARLEAVTAPQPDVFGPTPAAWSADVRIAATLLRAALPP